MKKTLTTIALIWISVLAFSQEKKPVENPKEAVKKDTSYTVKVVMTLDAAAYMAIKKLVGGLPISSGGGRLYEAITDTANVKEIRIKKPNKE